MSLRFRSNLKTLFLGLKRGHQAGFTLLELLVAIFISGIVVSGLLFLVIELLSVEKREESLTQTQQSMRRAIDYITRDVSEAVFVYSDLAGIVGQLDDAPAGTPVLAFWRLDPLTFDEVDDLNTFCAGKTGNIKSRCDTLLVRQNTYTLVVYFQQDNAADDIWEGQTRIVRYELPNYETISSSALTPRDGYADPTLLVPNVTPDTFNSFANWQKAAGETTDGISAVLTDFVDVENTDVAEAVACPPVVDPTVSDYARIPDASNSFYVCVAQPDAIANDQSSNKSLIVYVQGNASKGGANEVVGFSESSSLPKLESEVLIRGVIQTNP